MARFKLTDELIFGEEIQKMTISDKYTPVSVGHLKRYSDVWQSFHLREVTLAGPWNEDKNI